jgi:hypothetical protein
MVVKMHAAPGVSVLPELWPPGSLRKLTPEVVQSRLARVLFGEQFAALADAVGVAGESADFGMVDEAVDHCGGGGDVKDLTAAPRSASGRSLTPTPHPDTPGTRRKRPQERSQPRESA